MEEAMEDSLGNRLSTPIYVGSLYFVACGTLYLWGYWHNFNVNILEYLSLADIIKYTAYPVATAVSAFAIGVLLGAEGSVTRALAPGGGQATKFGQILYRYRKPLAFLYVFSCTALLIFGPIEKWFVLPLLFAFVIAEILDSLPMIRSRLPNMRYRTMVLVIASALPLAAYGSGLIAADNVLSAKQFDYLDSAIEGVAKPDDLPPDRRLRFLGHAGEYAFLWEPTRAAVVLIRLEDAGPLILRHYVSGQVKAGAESTKSKVQDQATPAAH
jgi:hypothetical protein